MRLSLKLPADQALTQGQIMAALKAEIKNMRRIDLERALFEYAAPDTMKLFFLPAHDSTTINGDTNIAANDIITSTNDSKH